MLHTYSVNLKDENMNDKQSPVVQKSYSFALRMVKLNKFLTTEKHEYILSKEALMNGTAIGAHIKAAQEADSRPGFTHEMSTALQRAVKTEYWLELLREADYLDETEFASIHRDWLEVKKLLVAIVKTSKGTY